MARQRDESYEERRQQILEGALEAFSTKGFRQATNKDVAAAAGIKSPGLIYHYFQDKADLLRAIAERYAPPLQLVAHADEVMALPLREALTRFAEAYLSLMEDPKSSAFVRLIMGQALRDPAFARLFAEIGPIRFLGLMATYMERQMVAGHLRRIAPEQAARTFIGPLLAYALIHRILQIPTQIEQDRASLIATTVDVFLNGLEDRKESIP